MARIEIRTALQLLGDEVIRVVGRQEGTLTHAASIWDAQNEQAMTFCSKSGTQAADSIRSTKAGVVLCADDPLLDTLAHSGKTLVVVRDPRLSFLRLVAALFTEPGPRGIHPTAVIDSEAIIHPDVYIGPFATLGRCEIGQGTVIHAHVHIYSKTRIGREVVIHAGIVIGADGFGYQRNEAGEFEKFTHVGGVVIEDNVEIGANTCVDRGTLGDTIIRVGAKIDNLVHIAHNVVVGRHTAVIAHAMVGGSTRIGDHAWVAPSACLRDGISIGNSVTIGLAALVVSDVPDGAIVMGAPARPSNEYKRLISALKQLAGIQ